MRDWGAGCEVGGAGGGAVSPAMVTEASVAAPAAHRSQLSEVSFFMGLSFEWG